MLWNVWKVPYMTYAELEERAKVIGLEQAHQERTLIARGLAFEVASGMVDSLGFGHSMHPIGGG